MTEIYKRYRLSSAEEPTDAMLQSLMEDVCKAARESSVKAEAEKRRRLQVVVNEIETWRKTISI
jgi:polyhydroxyalkanoate synthesis regulator phasin